MNKKFGLGIGAAALLTLTACGGGSSTNSPLASGVPTAAAAAGSNNGFADGSGFAHTRVYETADTFFYRVDFDGTSFSNDVALEGLSFQWDPTFTSVVVVYEGTSYNLVQSGANYTAVVNGVNLTLYPLEYNNEYEMYFVQASDLATFAESGMVVVGEVTDPSMMPSGGTATYTGDAYANLYESTSANGVSNIAEMTGNTTFNIDYGASTIDGTMVLDTSTDMSVVSGIPIVTITMPTTQIVGNTYGSTTSTIQFNQPVAAGTTFTDTIISGTFYGIVGQATAGTFAAIGSTNTSDLHVIGGYDAE